jgi:hypothetical protein
MKRPPYNQLASQCAVGSMPVLTIRPDSTTQQLQRLQALSALASQVEAQQQLFCALDL